MHRLFLRAVPAALLFAALAANAATIELVPSTAEVAVGQTFTVDLLARDLHLGAFDITVQFAPALVGVSNDPAFFQFFGSPDSFSGFLLDLETVNVAETSSKYPADLINLQTDGNGNKNLLLARLSFQALAAGVAQFDAISALLSDTGALTAVTADLVGTTVTIRGSNPDPNPAPVPEPGTLALSAVALISLSFLRRR